jgi:hypothetical protein
MMFALSFMRICHTVKKLLWGIGERIYERDYDIILPFFMKGEVCATKYEDV